MSGNFIPKLGDVYFFPMPRILKICREKQLALGMNLASLLQL